MVLVEKEEHDEGRNFPRGIELNERYYRWLDENNYVDRGAYADGKPEGKIVLTESGRKHMREKAVLRMMADGGYIDRDEFYERGKVVFTKSGKRYMQDQQKLAEEEARLEVGSFLNYLVDDITDQVMAVAAFIDVGRAEDVRPTIECLKEIVKVVPRSKGE